MYKFELLGIPVAKRRPRFSRRGDYVVTYNEQRFQENDIRYQILNQMSLCGPVTPVLCNVALQMYFHTPIPGSWSRKRRIAARGLPDCTRPDIDNYVKMYCDVMNELIYKDDRQVVSLYCEKSYSDRPRVELYITNLKEGDMINEHAATVSGEITIEDLNYMIRKANRIGLKSRELVRVFTQEDDEGKHYYFEVEGLKDGDGNKD